MKVEALIGRDEIKRYLEEAGVTGNGSLEEQLDAWGVDYDDFVMFVGEWTAAAAGNLTDVSLVQALQVAIVAGYELGYRSAVEAEQKRAIATPVPDALPEGFS